MITSDSNNDSTCILTLPCKNNTPCLGYIHARNKILTVVRRRMLNLISFIFHNCMKMDEAYGLQATSPFYLYVNPWVSDSSSTCSCFLLVYSDAFIFSFPGRVASSMYQGLILLSALLSFYVCVCMLGFSSYGLYISVEFQV